MNIIIPMAGMGKRLRPHTLTTPKPLIPIAGKPIVTRLVEDIAKVCGQKIDEIGFIIGDFGKEVEKQLLDTAESVGAKGKIYYQKEPLGTGHAILCAKESLSGPVVVAFADTLFKANFTLDTSKESVIWVHKVEDPSAFGVVELSADGTIHKFTEKPKEFVSDLAIIGIYFFKDGENLKNELQFLIDNHVIKSGEYQLTDAMENMKNKGIKFYTGKVEEWLDCGNKDATIYTNQRYLEYIKEQKLIDSSAIIENSVIIPPVYLGKNVILKNSIIGPYVSVGRDCRIESSKIDNSIIQNNNLIQNSSFTQSMLGSFIDFKGKSKSLSLGDYNSIEE